MVAIRQEFFDLHLAGACRQPYAGEKVVVGAALVIDAHALVV